ncbi:hypothetical protein DPMN_032288 [Dreissena polymorpha]|uniref:Uncharacterized protein n=1 Tax=Dreissena polymorpha TaxID=45954 RepID=A0A9D4RIS6_DREPO|nr:hypothetical protein DPMN_032288 [Dreissena polymorpha]
MHRPPATTDQFHRNINKFPNASTKSTNPDQPPTISHHTDRSTSSHNQPRRSFDHSAYHRRMSCSCP